MAAQLSVRIGKSNDIYLFPDWSLHNPKKQAYNVNEIDFVQMGWVK